MPHTLRVALIAGVLLASGPAVGQQANAGVGSYPAQTAFPLMNPQEVAKHLSAARHLAEPELMPEFNWRCLISPLDRQTVAGFQHNGLVQPLRVFDNLYSVGQNAVSAWAIDTTEGIILIDALNNADEARNIIVPNLERLGLDPARIRYVLITHAHGDHYGGAKYLQETYNARVVATEADWQMMAVPPQSGPFADLEPPKRDIVAEDGGVIALGSTRVHTYVTPGHTPGVMSLIFPVFDKGASHVAGLMGGTGGGQDAGAIRQHIASLERWGTLTKTAKADVLITNHSSHMSATEKLELLRHMMPGDTNPFIYGENTFQRYTGMLGECSRVQLARMGEAAD